VRHGLTRAELGNDVLRESPYNYGEKEHDYYFLGALKLDGAALEAPRKARMAARKEN